MLRYTTQRTASLAITLSGAAVHAALAIQVVALWRSLKWEPESEWESAHDEWRVDSIKVLWALLSAYFASSAVVSALGFYGIAKNKPGYIRFYRDYSIADFAVSVISLFSATKAVLYKSTRAGVCEELSRQPEIIRDLGDFGLSLENCERWIERASMLCFALVVVVLVARLHCLLAVSKYYRMHIARQQPPPLPLNHLPSPTSPTHPGPQRIYLLPQERANPSGEPVIYAPVPLSTLSPQDQARAKEAWISHGHRHHRSRSHAHHQPADTGRIVLPISPGEPLLPGYASQDAKA
ncbi:uncharacterized protein SCHCODRAFT_02622404 [Schizophyllum commune H4-8]|uniref:Expressed protein n=1 Tax=Schizophyllum commune (strain H4-8 / FGSC 9210) TaxID=578458 RepID=D8PQK9_SCHCM|nr:uncharacterized protein SCHCODRAFT_02622404 [Schizophyllum commune H4-8]KAI5893654.1 hypothetical protein SCHCODRAFT_02622404 [Schizophyllum commune H4-8]